MHVPPIWTHGAIPYDAVLATTLLLGTCVGAPGILVLGYANYSNRGNLLLWTKPLRLTIFLLLSIVLIPRLGPLGAATAFVSSDLIAQVGFLFFIIATEILKHPLRHAALLVVIMAAALGVGAATSTAIQHLAPGAGVTHFLVE